MEVKISIFCCRICTYIEKKDINVILHYSMLTEYAKISENIRLTLELAANFLCANH